jgi:hypothetical protein
MLFSKRLKNSIESEGKKNVERLKKKLKTGEKPRKFMLTL